jgi:Zn-dependent metalloprotease
MRATRKSRSLTSLVTGFCVSFLWGVSLGAPALDAAGLKPHTEQANALSAQLGADYRFIVSRSHQDELGMTHAHFNESYKGVRVFGGELITHADKSGRALEPTKSLFSGINVNVTPRIATADAVAAATAAMKLKGPVQTVRGTELVVYPIKSQVKVGAGEDATAYENRAVGYRLAYVVTSDVQVTAQTASDVYVIDAQTGAVIDHWDNLHSAAAVGTGNSEYSGPVQISTNTVAAGFELRDTTRGTVSGTFGVGNVVTDMAHGTTGNGTVYTDADDTWGDGNNYSTSNSTTSANGQTAAVDAAYGIQVTWDMYHNVFNRNGIDGVSTATYLRVHYSTGYDNAFWSDSCFCMTFGDGTMFLVLTPLDVAGHELSHGVTANNGHGGLTYSGESGGLNESSSDIMGTMAEFYGKGGGFTAHAATIPTTGGNWTIGEQIRATPLRYMYKPSKDGSSPDAWSSTIGSLDVHFSSGPGNRAFYFLSQGSSSNSSSDFYSSYLPRGMIGVGNDHAARIHYRALTTYYTSNATYANARTAYMSAAQDLYGTNSREYRAVQNAFAAINVGTPGPPDLSWLPSVIDLLLH